jgi:hypothetical protein
VSHSLKAYESIFEELKRQNWTVEQTSRGHYQAKSPNAMQRVATFGISGDPRGIKNAITQLRRSGFVWPPPEESRQERETIPETPPMDEGIESSEPKAANEPPTLPEPTLDDLFSVLRSARDDLLVADLQRIECKAVLERAEASLNVAEIEWEAARRRLCEAKDLFDAAFQIDDKRDGRG